MMLYLLSRDKGYKRHKFMKYNPIRESTCPECGKIFQATNKPEVALMRSFHMQEAHGATGPITYAAHPLRSRERELTKYKARYGNPYKRFLIPLYAAISLGYLVFFHRRS